MAATREGGMDQPTVRLSDYSRSQERLNAGNDKARRRLSTTSLPAENDYTMLQRATQPFADEPSRSSTESQQSVNSSNNSVTSQPDRASSPREDVLKAVPEGLAADGPLHSRTRAERHAVAREIVAGLRPAVDARIETLPASDQKAALLSCTHPTYLPPKPRKEEKKHLKQYEQLLRKSLKHEDSDHRRQARLVAKKARHLAASADEWEQRILPDFARLVKESRTRSMWWAGLPLRVRGKVWARCIGNGLNVSHDTFSTALRNAKVAEADLLARRSRGEDDSQELLTLDSFANLRSSVVGAMPTLRLFQPDGPLHGPLIDVLLAHRFYRADIEYHAGVASVAAMLLLNLPPPAAFIALVNLMNRIFMMALYTRDRPVIERKLSGFEELLRKVSCPHDDRGHELTRLTHSDCLLCTDTVRLPLPSTRLAQ